MTRLEKGIALFVFLVVASVPALSKAADNIGYDKGLFIKTDDDKHQMKLNIQLQPQYQAVAMEGQDNIHSFQIRRARFVFSGHSFTKKLTYKFQFEAVSGPVTVTNEGGAQTGPNLREAFLNYKFSDYFAIQAGQFKPFYNREELTSSTGLQFVDRSISNEVFSHGYDMGVGFLGAFFDKKLEYSLYAVNEGNSRNALNFNNELLFGGRLNWNIMGQHGYTQSDVKDSEEHQLVAGTAFSYNPQSRLGNNNTVAVEGDVAYRYQGLSLYGETNYGQNTDSDLQIIGFVGQAGYFLVPERFEFAARGAAVIPTTAGVINGYEFGGALNYFVKGHNIKLQTDYSMLVNSPLVYSNATLAAAGTAAVSGARNFISSGGNTPNFRQNQNDHRIRTQFQLFF